MLTNLEIKKYLYVVLSIVLAMLGLVGLNALGLDIPLLRQIVGFIFLTFIPGILVLRLLKVRNLSTAENLVYSVGLSIAFVMFLGLFMNMLYPVIGISKPISIYPVVTTVTIIALILGAIIYKREVHELEASAQSFSIRWSKLFSPPVLLLLLLPILSALGAFWVYLHYSNVPLLILLSLIALIVTLVAFGKFIPPRLYPLAIMSLSIALVWHVSLVSFHLPYSDVRHELGYIQPVLNNSVWDSTIISNLNAMLSVVILAPIYSLVLKLDIVWTLKIIYPLLFSLAPLALFQAYRKQTGDRIAFLGTFFFMSWTSFFSETPLMARQPIVELFLALAVLILVSKEISPAKRATLAIIFSFAIVVSHYGTSYVYMLYLLIALPLLLLLRSNRAKDSWERMTARFSILRRSTSIIPQSPRPNGNPLSQNTLTGTHVLLFVVFCLAWYMYVSSGSPFNSIVRIGDHIYSSVVNDFSLLGAKDPHVLQALGLMGMRGQELAWEIARVFQYATQFFIVVGVLGLIINWHKTKFYPEYVALSLVSMVILAMCVVLPHFASAFNMSRIYHLALFLIAPFCILGGIAFFRWLSQVFRLPRLNSNRTSLKLVVISILVPYFLFTTGFIFQLTGATPTSIPLSFSKADWFIYTGGEMRASIWLSKMPKDEKVFSDGGCGALLYYGGVTGVRKDLYHLDTEMEPDSYIFLRRWNVTAGEILVSTSGQGKAYIYENLEGIELLKGPGMDKIYDNKEAQILWYSP